MNGCRDLSLFKMIRANIPKEFWHIDLDNFDGDSKAMRMVEKYCNKLDSAREKGIGFLFMGQNGVGKTSLSIIILKEALAKGYSAFYVTLPEIFRQIYLGYKHVEVLMELKKKLYDTDFLVISELGKDYHRADATLFMRSEFDTIFRQRRGDLRPIIMDTNLDMVELSDNFGDSIISLFRSRLKILTLKGNDYRKVHQEKEVDKFFKEKK
jgi:DNA replication protein DnaC